MTVGVRELKNQTTAILRRVEAGETVTVSRRGRVIAELRPAAATVPASDSIYQRLRRYLEVRSPALRAESPQRRAREFDRLARKVRRALPYRTWREMDRAAKGDRFGLSRQ
jgi:prevent-host-death family protein